MPRYRVEAYRLTELEVHDVLAFLEYNAVDGPSSRVAADAWLGSQAFALNAVTNVQILVGDRIVAQKEIGHTVWETVG